MDATAYKDIKSRLQHLYTDDDRPWLVGFSGGKDSTLVAALIFEIVLSLPVEKRRKPISIVCTDTRVEIPAIVEMTEGTLRKMRAYSEKKRARYRCASPETSC